MKQYDDLLNDILSTGVECHNRTATPTLSVFGRQNRFNLSDGFPILTRREQPFAKIVAETLWYLFGDISCDFLDENNVKVWKLWTDDETNSVGPIYGSQLRHWQTRSGEIDQVSKLINDLKERPESRRLVLTIWNPEYLPDEDVPPVENVKNGKMALAPCQSIFQFYAARLSFDKALASEANREAVEVLALNYLKYKQSESKEILPYLRRYIHDAGMSAQEIIAKLKEIGKNKISDFLIDAYWRDDSLYEYYIQNNGYLKTPKIKQRQLSIMTYQRSLDVGCAGGWNVTQQALILNIIACLTDMIPFEVIHTIGNAHIYLNQIKSIRQHLTQKPYPLPKLELNQYDENGNPYTNIEQFRVSDFKLINYKHSPKVVFPISV